VLLRSVILSLAIGGFPAAAELYSWHTLETPVLKGKGYELVLQSRLRSRHELTYLDQLRAGGILRWNATPRLIPYAGAYFQPQQVRSQQWVEGRRFFAGLEAPFRLGNSLALTMRIAAERHVGTGRADYNRYRTFGRLVLGRRRVAPFVQNEWLAVRQGFHSVRNSGGLRVRVTPQLTVEGGYLYDIRREFWGGDRRALVTGVRWHPKAP
jgi:hypothetical protein